MNTATDGPRMQAVRGDRCARGRTALTTVRLRTAQTSGSTNTVRYNRIGLTSARTPGGIVSLTFDDIYASTYTKA